MADRTFSVVPAQSLKEVSEKLETVISDNRDGALTSEDLMSILITQMKVMNFHLQTVTGLSSDDLTQNFEERPN